MATPPLGASLHSGYTLYPDPDCSVQAFGAPPGSSPGLGWGPRPGQAWVCLSRGRGETGERAGFSTLYSVLTLFKYLYPRCAGLDLCSPWFENRQGTMHHVPAAASAHSLPGHCACGAAARRA